MTPAFQPNLPKEAFMTPRWRAFIVFNTASLGTAAR
jgi:hypothetical protein